MNTSEQEEKPRQAVGTPNGKSLSIVDFWAAFVKAADTLRAQQLVQRYRWMDVRGDRSGGNPAHRQQWFPRAVKGDSLTLRLRFCKFLLKGCVYV